MLPTIDFSTVLKIAARKAISALFKSSLSLLIGLSVLISALVTTLVSFFDKKILPTLPDVSSFSVMSEAGDWWDSVSYILALDVARDFLVYFYNALDKVVIFVISFLVSGFFASVAYHWSAAFRRDLEHITSGI